MPYIANNNDTVCLKKQFITEKLAKANAVYVKIYIYLLAFSGSSIEYNEVANSLDLLESDVINAVKYWVTQGAIFEKDGSIAFEPTSDAAPIPQKPVETPIAEKEIRVQKSDYTVEKVSDAVIASPALRDMLAVAEELLQKPINSNEMETLYWFYDGLGLSPEAVLMLLEYCVDKGKPRLSYAEKVALSWCDRGLNTPEAISQYLRENERKNDDIKYITAAMGISGRPLAAGEEQAFKKWTEELNMSREMILLAHEYCIMQTGKLSFPYIDKILERWAKDGITTTAAAQAEHDAHRAKNTGSASAKGSQPEYNDIEQIIRSK